jgi:hypothetical protein
MFGSIDPMATYRPANLARRIVLGLSAIVCAYGLFRIGRTFLIDGKLRFGNPISAETTKEEAALGTPPLTVKAEVTRVSGSSGVRPGQTCNFFVERRQRAQNDFWCSTQVVCGGKLIYGGNDRGFFSCRFYEGDRRDVVGGEAETTREDRDGALRIDTRQGVLRVWDDASGPLGEFDVEAEVLTAQ